MNDEKINHLRKLALLRRHEKKPVNDEKKLKGQTNDLLSIIKNHSGIPFAIALIRNFKLSGITYEKYEVLEENLINLLEVSSFIMNYFVSSKNKFLSRLLKIIDKVILVVRFKILIFKIFKLYKIQKTYNLQKSHTIESKITIREELDSNKLLKSADSEKLLEESFENAWSNNSEVGTPKIQEIKEGDINALSDFESTEDQIHGLRTEIVVEFIDFLLLLYPRSITGLIYDKIFGKKSAT